MADSPLAEINWDNLEGQELITAVNLLQLAFSERANFADLVGKFRFVGNNRRVLNRFPFFSNPTDVGRPTWPAMWGGHVPTIRWDLVLSSYLSQTKLNNIIDTAFPIISLRANQFTQDQDTLLTDLGIPLTGNRATEYPRMDIITTENVRFWYDLITSLKHVFVDDAFGGAGSGGGSKFLSAHSEGIFTLDRSEVIYGGGLGPPFAQLAGDWSSLWTGPTVKKLISGSSPSWKVSYDFQTSGRAAVRAINTYSRFDTSAFDAIGHTGIPEEVLTYGGYGNGSDGGTSWSADNGIEVDKIIQFPNSTRTILGGNIVERNIPITPPTQPTNVSNVDFNLSTAHFSFESWDYDGGFEFYTPT